MSEKCAADTAWTRLASETAPPPNAVIELAKFPIQCGEQMPWLAIGMNLDGFNLKEVFLGATHWRLAPQRRHELTVGVPADEISRLTARIAELEKALTKIESGSFPDATEMALTRNWKGIVAKLQEIARTTLEASGQGTN
jgi:hypothetical protein